MKRIISIFLVLLIFLCSPAFAYADNSSATVYVTKSGEKYHRSGCRYLEKSCISLSLREAVESGYTSCSVCKPVIPNFEYTVSRSRSHASGTRHSDGSVETAIIVVLIALPVLVHVYDEITFAKKRKAREVLEEARRREIARRLRYEKAKLAEAQRRNSIQERYGGKSYSDLVSVPSDIYFNASGYPCVKGDSPNSRYSLVVSDLNRCYHRPSCAYAAGHYVYAFKMVKTDSPEYYYFNRSIYRRCPVCRPIFPDMSWYREYQRIKGIKEKYRIE